jgi:ADP-ribosyl-[dinitrogen reductase] hydrolase
MLLGAAIGDSLGATSEGKSPARRRKLYDEIIDYIPGRRSGYKAIGVPTDDTQLTFLTLEQLITDKGLIPNNLAKCFCKYRIHGIGTTTKEFIRNYKDKKVPWYKAGLNSLGNGVLMRISPIVVPYLRNPHPSMYADAALDAMITHNAFGNISSSIAFVNIIWSLLSMSHPPDSLWWINMFCSIAENIEGESRYHHPSAKVIYEGSLWQFTERVMKKALSRNLSVREACHLWGSGANLFETVPTVLYILAKHSHNAEEAIIRAVNDTQDNDTVASIVGAAVGALHGVKSIPHRWIKELSGRIKNNDAGRIFKLISKAKQVFWSSCP